MIQIIHDIITSSRKAFFSLEKHFYWVLLTYSNLILERRLGRASSLLRRRKETLAWVYNELFYPMIAWQTFIKSCANIKIEGNRSLLWKITLLKTLKEHFKIKWKQPFCYIYLWCLKPRGLEVFKSFYIRSGQLRSGLASKPVGGPGSG